MKRFTTYLIFLMLLGYQACYEHDIGQDCPQLLESQGYSPADGSSFTNTTETLEIVAQNVSFPCASLVCIATEGDLGYCSKKCRNDAGCPLGFECRKIQDIGPFADEQFCAFARCVENKDCGDVEQFECKTIPGIHPDPATEVRLCRFKN